MKSLLQTPEWGDFKSETGEWFSFSANNLLILARKLPLGKYFFYIPEPNSLDWQESLADLIENLKPFIEKYRPIFIRIEPLEKDNQLLKDLLVKNGWQPAFEEVQPKYRQWLPLESSAEELLAQMKPKGRYNIKLAQNHEVKIEPSTDETLEKDVGSYYDLVVETSQRDNFSIRPKKYFQDLVAMLYRSDLGKLYLAKYNGKVIAGAIISFSGGWAAYLYGASSSEDRNLMAPYLIHWQVIKDAQERGCKIYDFLAIAPPDQENHKHAGISRFKQQFGGESVTLIGGWDKILSPVWYLLFKLSEIIRRR